MVTIDFTTSSKRGLNVLCLGAHADDIEIGCGGTLLKLLEKKQNLHCYWIVFSANQKRQKESKASAEAFLNGAVTIKVEIKNFKESYFPYIGADIKDFFEELKKAFSPDIVFTHNMRDLHQDHRLISELTWNTFRDHLVLEYEIPKYDGDLGAPNFFVALDKVTCQKKVGLLMEHFSSQHSRPWFSEEVFFTLLRLRGVEINSSDGYAEAFYCRKVVY